MINRLCIIGVGLIGGSLAKDLRRLGLADEVIGCSRKRENLERARELGIIDSYDVNPAGAVEGADMVVLAVPLGAMAEVLTAMVPGLDGPAVLTDVGSAKGSVLEAARSAFGAVPENGGGGGGTLPGAPGDLDAGDADAARGDGARA
jgi:prephenate dehydrogenase